MKANSTFSVSNASVADIIRRLFEDGRDRSLAQVRDDVGYPATAAQVSRALTELVRAGELSRPRRGVYSKLASEDNLTSQTSPNVIPDQRSTTAASPITAAPPAAPVFTRMPRRPPVPVPVAQPTPPPRPSNPSAPNVRVQPTTFVDVEPYRVPNWIHNAAFLAPLGWLVVTGLALILGGQIIGLMVGAGCLIAVLAFYVSTAKYRLNARMFRASISR